MTLRCNRRDLAAVLVCASLCFLYLFRLDAYELTKIDECRSGVIVRDMTEGGHWILPRTPDGYYSEKPVLYYALCALFVRIYGTGEVALRGVSALMSLATMALVWTLTRLYGSRVAAWIAVVVFAANLLVMRAGRSATVDMTLSFFICAGLTAYFAARQGRLSPRVAALLCGASFGLAALTKGPIGGALPVCILVALHVLETRGRFWRRSVPVGPVLGAVAVFAAIAVPWYVIGYQQGGREFLDTSLLSENWYMPLGSPIGLGVGHPKPLYFYAVHQAVALVTVIPLVPITLVWLCSVRQSAARTQLGAWFVFGFLFFLVATNKRTYYLMPLQPAVAALIGLGSASWLEERAPALLRASCAGVGLGLLALGVWGLVLGLGAPLPSAASDLTRQILEHGRGVLMICAAGATACSVLLIVASRRSPRAIVQAVLCSAFLFLAVRCVGYETLMGRLDETRPFVGEMLARLPVGATPVVVAGPGYALDFYWPTRLPHGRAQAASAVWLFVDTRRLTRLSGAFTLIGTSRAADPKESVSLVERRVPQTSGPVAAVRLDDKDLAFN